MKNAYLKVDNLVSKVLDIIGLVFETVGIVALMVVMLVLAGQTIASWGSISILWSDEVAAMTNAWLIFMGAAVMAHEQKHVQVDFFTKKLPKKVQIVIEVLLMAAIIWACYKLTNSGMMYIARTRNIRTSFLKLPQAAIYTAPLVALWYIIVVYARLIINNVLALFNVTNDVKEVIGK